jgi:predicted nucleic acid-binding protein
LIESIQRGRIDIKRGRREGSVKLIKAADLLIAAIALIYDMTVVTIHMAHSARIVAMRVED